MSIIYSLAGLVSLVCWILTLVKLFQSKGVLHGILGIICGLYTFIWGWMNTSSNDNKMIMIIWTVAIILSMATGASFYQSMLGSLG